MLSAGENSSIHYRELFNRILKDDGYEIEYYRDLEGGIPNKPELGEVRVTVKKEESPIDERINYLGYVCLTEDDDKFFVKLGLSMGASVTLTPKCLTLDVQDALNRTAAKLEARLQTPSWAKPSTQYTDHLNDAFQALAPADSRKNIGPDARILVELEREKTVEAGYTQWKFVANPTKKKLGKLNPAEERFRDAVRDPLAKEADQIYCKQLSFNCENYEAWFAGADLYSRKHFERNLYPNIRPDARGKSGDEAARLQSYANVFPWFEKRPPYSAMMPEDWTDKEQEYIDKNFAESSLIRQPFSVVERMSEKEANEFQKKFNNRNQVVSETVKGLKGWLLITNMAHHPRFRPHFLRIGDILRDGMQKSTFFDVNAERWQILSDAQLDYFRTIAADAEEGDFFHWLEKELEQTKPMKGGEINTDSLYLSIFPHEGYFKGKAYAMCMHLGIRERIPSEDLPIYNEMVQYLENRTAKILKPINGYKERKLTADEALANGATIVWTDRAGGMFHAIPGNAVGNDFPKGYVPENLKGEHRSIVWIDTTAALSPIYMEQAKTFLPEEYYSHMSENGKGDIDGTFAHEAAHGTGMRPNSKTSSGRTFNKAYENFGLMAEPMADVAIFVGWGEMVKRGRISRERFKNIAYENLFPMLRRIRTKEEATSEESFTGESGHEVANNVIIGRLNREGALSLKPNNDVVVDIDKLIDIANELYDEMTAYSGKDTEKKYHEYLKDNINSISGPLLKYLLEAQGKSFAPVLIDR